MLAGFAALLIENMDRDFQRQVEETFRAGQPQRLAPDFLCSKESKNFTLIFLRLDVRLPRLRRKRETLLDSCLCVEEGRSDFKAMSSSSVIIVNVTIFGVW